MSRSVLSARDRNPITPLPGFAPDWALPAQMPDRHSQETGERALLRAVLEQALTDLRLTARVREPSSPRPDLRRFSRALARAGKRQDLRRAQKIRAAVQRLTTAWRIYDDRQALIAWFEDDDGRWLYSFARICAHLGFDPEAWRQRLRARGWVPGELLPQRQRQRSSLRIGSLGAPACQRHGDWAGARELRAVLQQLVDAGWTQRALERATKCPESSISAWRTGISAPLEAAVALGRFRALLTQPVPAVKPSGRAAAAKARARAAAG